MVLLPGLPLLLSTAVLSPVAQAASYDPELTWRTLQTEHFNITFHGGEEQLAEELAVIAEQVFVDLTAELAWAPRRRTEIVLVDNTDSANGYAMTLPVNTIVIFVTAPEFGSTLSLYENWLDGIFTHEYVHILHLDTIEGLPRALRAVMGRIVSVNQLSPGWVVEGQATFQETRHTDAGRGRSAYVDMIKRVTVLNGEFPPLGSLDGFQVAQPAGNLRYLFGQDFLQYISDQTGEAIWTDWNHTYGGWPLPYVLPTRRVFGASFPALYQDWKDHLIARYASQRAAIEAEGVTPFRLLSDGEDYCAAPTFSPDGQKLVWSCSDPHRGPAIYLARADGLGAERTLDQQFAVDFTWRADSRAFVYTSRRVVDRFNLYSDIYLHTLDGPTQALTLGDRARDPAFSPDGEQLLVVTNAVQNNQLERLTVDRRRVPLTENTDHTQYAAPRFSPDGRHVALSVWQDGRQDLWLYDADGHPVRRLTMDIAQDLDPWWSADGRTLYFSSDRSGVPNIYAVDLEDERLWQVTNVLGGAFRPVTNPAETAMVFEYYDHNGPNVAWMDLDRARWRDRGHLPRPLEHRTPLATLLPSPPLPLPPPPPLSPPPDAETTEKKSARKEKARRASSLRRSPAGEVVLTEAYGFPGLTGLGGPLHGLSHRPGPWGLPGERGPMGGEFPADQPTSGPDSILVETSDNEAPEEQDYPFTHPVGRYNPLPTLLPPRYISPSLYRTAYGYQGALATAGTDTLRNHLYSAYASYRTDSHYIGWGAAYSLNRWIPIFTVGFSTYTVPFGDLYVTSAPPSGGGAWIPSIESANYRYWDRRDRGYVQITYPKDTYRTWFLRWDGSLRSPWLVPNEALGITRGAGLPDNAYRPFLPSRGFFSSVGGGWYFARGRYYNYSISPEETRIVSVVGSISHPLIGAYTLDDSDQREDFTQILATVDWREYRTVPWPERWGLHNHVLALKVAGGGSLGDSQRYGNFRLGGDFGESSYNTLPDEWRALRGFPAATVQGAWYTVASAEYRFPLWWIDRGAGILPGFARYLSGAVFVDAGTAFDAVTSLDPGETLVGAGAEVRASAVVGWGIPLTTRLGYAVAVRGEGYVLGDLAGLYFWLGTSF